MQISSAVTSGFIAVASALLWLCVTAIGVLENSGGRWPEGFREVLFRNDSHVLMEKRAVDISLPKWSLCIWEFIYTWNTMWLIYCVAIICRPVSKSDEENNPIAVTTCSVNAFPPSFYYAWAFAGISHVFWIFCWDREVLVTTVFFQAFVVIACISSLYISHVSVHGNGTLLQATHPWDLWVCRTLVQNGIAMHATWSGILLFINLASLLTYDGGIPSESTSLGALGAIAFFLLLWFILDIFVLDRWVRYTFSIYPTIMWATGGILLRHFSPWSNVTIVTLSILGASLLILVIRVPLVVWRSFSSPLYLEEASSGEMAAREKCSKHKREQLISTVL